MSRWSFSKIALAKTGSKPLACFLILLVVWVTFAPTLQNDFVNWDDDVFLLENRFIQQWDVAHLKAMFTHVVHHTYLPLTQLSFAIEHHFFGYDPLIYHAVNVLIHSATAAVFFFLCLRMGLPWVASFLAALVFALHPMKVESVAWVTGRKDVLYSFFYVLAFFHYVRYCDEKKRRYFILAVFWALLSILAKPFAITFICVMVLWDWYKRRGWSVSVIIEKLLAYAPLGLVAQVTFNAHPRSASAIDATFSYGFWEQILLWSWGIVFYFKQFIFPFKSVLFYKIPEPITFFNGEYLTAFILVALIVASCVVFKRHRSHVFCVLFFLLTISIVLIFPGIDSAMYVQDRYMYIPSIGLCMLAGLSVGHVLRRTMHRQALHSIVIALIITVLGAFIMKTIHQIRIWRDGVHLWEHQMAHVRGAVPALIYHKLGEAYLSELDDHALDEELIDQIIHWESKALEIKPDLASAHYDLGMLYRRLGETDKAIFHYQQPIAFDPFQPQGYFHLGTLYQRLGQDEEALRAFGSAIAVQPQLRSTYINVALALDEALGAKTRNEIYEKARSELAQRYRAAFQESIENGFLK